MPGEETTIKGDMLLQSKHADASFNLGNSFALFWFNTPVKGKCTSVTYCEVDYPAVYVTIGANWRARKKIARYGAEGGWRTTRF
jgi:hypothetical protein